jgi:SAM-dependent methyltransferase
MTSSSEYIKDNELNLFRRVEFGGVPYSDGQDAEQQLYESVRAASDRSTFSPELARAIFDWPSEYHLSRERHCLLRPLGINQGDKVLELGSGCGAITRFLGELGAEVTAVEGSLQRARIAAERCRDLPNVRVVVDDLLAFQSEVRYQWVLLVGVLEYASVFSDHRDAAQHYLLNAARFLAENGKLVVAIENKLGLKYFNGLVEDHIGIPFFGVQGLYGAKTPRTFGRRELERLIKGAGLDHFKFYYPFPDYKLPRVVLSDVSLRDDLLNPADLLALCAPRDYGRQSFRLFADALAITEVARNELLADLSNSFLVVASPHPLPSDDRELAVTFSASRVREFATQTRFVRSPSGIQVIKEPLEPNAVREATLKDGSTLKNLLEPSEYVRGRLLYWRLLVARTGEGSFAEIIEALRPWFQFLLEQVVNRGHAASNKISDLYLSGRALDFTPLNLIEREHGIVAIDDEWAIDRDIPLGWVVTRSVLHALTAATGFEKAPIKVRDVISTLCSDHGLTVSDLEIQDWLACETDLMALVSGFELKNTSIDVSSSASLPLHQVVAQCQAQIRELTGIVAGKNDQIAALHNGLIERDKHIASLYHAIAKFEAAPLRRAIRVARRGIAKFASSLKSGSQPPG